jgi:hypothetical protein
MSFGPWPLLYIGWRIGLMSLWAQLVRVRRLCLWRVYPKALGSIVGCLEWLLPVALKAYRS